MYIDKCKSAIINAVLHVRLVELEIIRNHWFKFS